MKKSDMNEELETLIEHRIEEMESKDYEFPKRFSKRDYIVTAFVAVICLAAVIAGAFIV